MASAQHPPPARPVAGSGAQEPRCCDPNLGPRNFSAVVAHLPTRAVIKLRFDPLENEAFMTTTIDDDLNNSFPPRGDVRERKCPQTSCV